MASTHDASTEGREGSGPTTADSTGNAGVTPPRTTREGIPASPGIVIAPARVLRTEVPEVPHGRLVPEDQVDAEVQRFRDACAAVAEQIRRLQAVTSEHLGEVEAQIFEPQLLMLADDELIGGTERYIRENHLSAERAFEWRVLEWEAQWSHTAHPMVLDKLNDLADVQARIKRSRLGEILRLEYDFLAVTEAGLYHATAEVAREHEAHSPGYREAIAEKLDAGLSVQRIWQDLVDEFGYSASYESVKRYVRTITPRRRAVGVFHQTPGAEAQVDFFRGAPTLDAVTEKCKNALSQQERAFRLPLPLIELRSRWRTPTA